MKPDGPELRHIHDQVARLGNRVLGLRLCETALREADAEGRFHLTRLLRWIEALPPARSEPRWNPGASSGGPQPGLVDVVLIDGDDSGEAFLARVVAREADALQMPLEAGPSFAEVVDLAERVLLRLLHTQGGIDAAWPGPLGSTVHLEGPPGLTRMVLSGTSMAAAIALALASRWSGQPVPRSLVVIGGLDEQGRLTDVLGLENKVRCALREMPELTEVIVPTPCSGADPRVVPMASLEALLDRVLGPEAIKALGQRSTDLEGMIQKGLELFRYENRFASAYTLFEHVLTQVTTLRAMEASDRAIPAYGREEFTALFRAGACLSHLGHPDGARLLLDRAERLGEVLWRERVIGPDDYLGFLGTLAVSLRDQLRFSEAETLLRSILVHQTTLRQSGQAMARTLGNLGEVLTFLERWDEAELTLKQALHLLEAGGHRDEVPRELCYLGNLFRRRGEARAALEWYDQGLHTNREARHGQGQNEAFLRHGKALALLTLGEFAAAEAQATRGLAPLPHTRPYPRQFLLRTRGLSRYALGRLPAALDDLSGAAKTTYVRGDLLRFGVSMALCDLYRIHQAQHQAEPALEAARTFIREAGPYLDRYHHPETSLRLTTLLEAGDAGQTELTYRMQAVCARFPAG